MITDFEIKNFRCFDHVKRDGLRRFNFLVGPSGSGKTALLEALFIAAGSNPEIYFRLRRWRGFNEAATLTATRESYEAIFRDLFYKFNQETGARVEFTASNTGHRSVDIFYKDDEVLHLPLRATSTGSEDVFSVIPIVFKWTGPKRITESQIEIVENGSLRMKGSKDIYAMTFVSSQTLDPRSNALRYSELSKHGRSGVALDAMKDVYPEIKDLSLEFIAGEPMLHASISESDEKYPIANLSGGMNKYLSIVLSIISVPHGAVIIDELENGFYYSDLAKIVGGMMKLCSTYDTQMFATSHSYELLQAVAKVIEGDEKFQSETTLIRLEKKSPVDPPTLHLSNGRNYSSAIESDFEVR